MQLRPIPFSALIVVAALAAGCDVHVGENGVSLDVASGKASDEWSRTYTVASGGAVEIVNTNGAIVVEPSTGAQVEVKATRQTRAPSDEEAQALLKNLEIKEEVSDGRVHLQTSTGTGMLFGRRSASVEYHLRVPAGLKVSVKTENGGIGMHDVNGSLSASTTNGGIRGTNLSGSVSAHIINGGIVVDLASVAGPIDLDAVNGGIRLDIPADAKLDVEARAVNGGVNAEAGLALSGGERTRNGLSGKLNGGGTKVSATTVNGGVRIGSRSATASGQKGTNGDVDLEVLEVDGNTVVVPKR